jgi:hypothetical protein
VLLAATNQNYVYGVLIAAPPLVAILVCYSFWRWSKRDAEREAREREGDGP